MKDTIATTECQDCGRKAPTNGPHFCRTDRRLLLQDVNTEQVFVDLLAR